ncbi:GerAB/ArcD/ProY family transporter [Brassicibacter mesophilus]|uniref:GerAB/ArcD/ProY family transporter n=1 Tax=Brassicibacter mesophilus TaxID=745119 RepID=UPI003D1B7B5C
MKKEIVSDSQSIATIIFFMIGTSSILVRGLEAKKDAWIAIIIALVIAAIFTFIYAYILAIFPGKDLFDICETLFGKAIGKIICISFISYIFLTESLVLRNMGDFIKITSLTETPLIIPIIATVIVSIIIVKQGTEVIGRWSRLFILPVILLMIIALILLTNKMNVNNIFPILDSDIKTIMEGATSTFSFPFAEIIVFTMAFPNFSNKKSTYKVYMMGLAGGAIGVLLNSVTNIFTIGEGAAMIEFYPTYTAISTLRIGNFLQRIEVIAALVFTLGGFIKLSIYLLAACNGISKLFGCKDYRFLVVPIGLLFANLAYLVFDSAMSYLEWDTKIWKYYAFTYQVILPVMILIAAKSKKRKTEKNLAN